MTDDQPADRIEKMKEMDSGPGVDDVLDVYDGNSGYSGDIEESRKYPSNVERRTSYSDSSA
jgi:hypothetical protein